MKATSCERATANASQRVFIDKDSLQRQHKNMPKICDLTEKAKAGEDWVFTVLPPQLQGVKNLVARSSEKRESSLILRHDLGRRWLYF